MIGQMRFGALFGVLVMMFALAMAQAAETEIKWISLQGGLQARLLNVLERPGEDGGDPEVLVNFMLSDPSVIADHTKVIAVADQLFGRVVMVPADTKGFKRAGVMLLITEKLVGDTTVQVFEDFHYARGDNNVWLRQAGPEAWKVAQDPNDWMPPTPQVVQLPSGTVYIDFLGEVFAPPGFKRAFGIEMRSSTSVLDVQAKYTEMKEFWAFVRKDKLKESGFDFARMENYGEAQRGRFQVRKMVYLNIPRKPDEDWPPLPDQMPDALIVAGLDSGLADEAAQLASIAIAAVVPAQPVAPVAAHSNNIGAGVGVGREAADPKAKIVLGDYLNPVK